jgi:hypothetical protein
MVESCLWLERECQITANAWPARILLSALIAALLLVTVSAMLRFLLTNEPSLPTAGRGDGVFRQGSCRALARY